MANLKYIAVENCKIETDNKSGTVNISTFPSQKVKYDGKKSYYGTISFTVSEYIDPSTFSGPASTLNPFTINGTSSNTKIENKKAVLEGDKNDNVIVSGPSVAYPYNPTTKKITVTINNAGQSKVKTK